MKIDFYGHRHILLKELAKIRQEPEFRYAKVVGAIKAAARLADDVELYDALEAATAGRIQEEVPATAPPEKMA